MGNRNEKWYSYLKADRVQLVEQSRKDMSLLTMIIIAIFVLSGLIISNHEIYSQFLLYSLIGALVMVVTSATLFYLTSHRLGGRLLLCTGVLLFNCSLIYSGGTENTALYWVMYYPLIVYSITGPKFGSLFSLAFLAMSAYFLYTPGAIIAEYADTEKSRYLLSSFVIVIFSFINEFYRFKSHNMMESVSLDNKKDANTDVLTNIPNRRFLEDSYFPYLQKNNEVLLPAAVIIADIDHFKMINDTHGHDIGDLAIIHCVNTFKKTLRNTDVLCRIGGEEFLICIPKMSLNKAEKIANKMRSALADNPLKLEDGAVLQLRSSFGVAEITSPKDFNSAIKLADDRLYKAKETGRNKVVAD
ncbi:GGDEF domain-containing protein [Psychrosphaera ytuae]|uniref:diguanylate cyclase n=1 Tax=Psychrosphaera ytuae TaxID=2820710 RepID=A0A975D9E3_9GAMM|nr:GGDEF domain-containing protein [Psychrosphaera ytuae]QTH62957.1 GGDEF domain-containing protein [Psychrosphaera ytuae]